MAANQRGPTGNENQWLLVARGNRTEDQPKGTDSFVSIISVSDCPPSRCKLPKMRSLLVESKEARGEDGEICFFGMTLLHSTKITMCPVIKMSIWNFSQKIRNTMCILYIYWNHCHRLTQQSVGMGAPSDFWIGWKFSIFGCITIFKVFCGTMLSSGGVCMKDICSTSTYKREWIWS